MSDHMLTIEWTKEGNWGKPKIIPYQDLKISPAASCLHYGAFLSRDINVVYLHTVLLGLSVYQFTFQSSVDIIP